jgi:hypothetical protein
MQHGEGTTGLGWIEHSALATAMRQDIWLYPAIEILHIFGFVTLVGSIAMLDLRLLGLSPRIPVRLLARHLLPWTLGALIVIVPTGLMMFIAHASDFISNTAFVLKMSLIFAAGFNAIAFHLGPYRSVSEWDSNFATPAAAKAHALVSILIWMGVITCGRLLAYL